MEQGDKVRFTYVLPGDRRPSTIDGTITGFMYKSQKAVIDTKRHGTLTVPIAQIIRVIR